MKFRGQRALRQQFPEGFILQLRMITERNSTLDAEGPAASGDAAIFAFRLAAGQEIPDVIKAWKAKWKEAKP